jgi:hypothetical protein
MCLNQSHCDHDEGLFWEPSPTWWWERSKDCEVERVGARKITQFTDLVGKPRSADLYGFNPSAVRIHFSVNDEMLADGLIFQVGFEAVNTGCLLLEH